VPRTLFLKNHKHFNSHDLWSLPSSSDVLECKDVTVTFEGLTALEDVTLQVKRGEVVGLIGPNGAGKTTLANVFTGFQRPDRGKAFLSGRDITNLAPHRISRMGVSRTFQSVRLFAELTLHQNVEVAAINGGLDREPAQDLAGELLDWFNLGDKWHLKANSLTYSDERRVGIARALALRPKFVLLDEPAAGMSDAECDDLIRRIREIPNRFSCGALLIDHNMRVVMDLCRRIQVLEFGRTIAEGTPAEIQAHPEVLRAYLGTRSNQP
jgi:branched-chain amino acid transport system ATP-binding protein